MSNQRPNEVPHTPTGPLAGIDEDVRMEWHARVPHVGLSFGIDENLRFADGVGFTNDDDEPLDIGDVPEEYRSAEFQKELGSWVTNHRVILQGPEEQAHLPR